MRPRERASKAWLTINALAAFGVGSCLLPPGATASTVAVETRCDSEFRSCSTNPVLRAAAGEANDVTVRPAGPNRFVFEDRGSALVAGSGCALVGAAALCVPGSVPFDGGGGYTQSLGGPLIYMGDVDDHALLLVGGFADGGTGRDRLEGSAERDRLEGGSGDDRLSGGDGGDELVGASGADRLSGGDGPDLLLGQAGRDRLRGNAGRDRLSGGSGNDRLFGFDGDRDRLNCGGGRRDRTIVDQFDRARGCEALRELTFETGAPPPNSP